MNDEALGDLGPVLGTPECAHETVTYYTGVEGIYAVCHACMGHFWDAKPPEGAEVIDLMAMGDDDENECAHGVPVEDDCETCDELTARYLRHLATFADESDTERSRPADAGDQNPAAAIGPTSDGGAATLEQEGDA